MALGFDPEAWSDSLGTWLSALGLGPTQPGRPAATADPRGAVEAPTRDEASTSAAAAAPGAPSFDALPEELQRAVFVHLRGDHAGARQVCKKWLTMSKGTISCLKPRVLRTKRIVRSFPNLTELDLSVAGGVTDAKLQGLESLSSLSSLSLKRAKEVTDRGLATVARIPGLEVLNLGRLYNISDAGLAPVLAGCTRLRELSIAYCFRLTEASLQAIAELPELQSLSISRCRHMNDAALSHLPRLAPSLRVLKMRDVALVGEAGFAAIGALTRLEALSAPLGIDGEHRRTDDCIASLAPLAGCLRRLHLGLGSGVGPEGVRGLAALTRLEALECGQAYAMDDAAAAALAGNLPALTSLSLEGPEGLSDAGLAALTRLGTLDSLSISDAPGLSDAGVASLSSLHRLRRLRFSRCDGVSGSSLQAFQSCPGLEEVALDHCTGASGESLLALGELPGLQRLSLAGTQADDDALGKVFSARSDGSPWFPRLAELRLSDAPRLKGSGFRRAVGSGGFRALRKLDLSFCASLEDGALAAASGMRALEHLNLSLCGRITDAGLDCLATGAGCQRLSRLELAGCEAVTEPAVRSLRAELPALAHVERRHSSPALLQVLLARQA